MAWIVHNMEINLFEMHSKPVVDSVQKPQSNWLRSDFFRLRRNFNSKVKRSFDLCGFFCNFQESANVTKTSSSRHRSQVAGSNLCTRHFFQDVFSHFQTLFEKFHCKQHVCSPINKKVKPITNRVFPETTVFSRENFGRNCLFSFESSLFLLPN